LLRQAIRGAGLRPMIWKFEGDTWGGGKSASEVVASGRGGLVLVGVEEELGEEWHDVGGPVVLRNLLVHGYIVATDWRGARLVHNSPAHRKRR